MTESGWDHRNRMISVVPKDSGGAVIKAVEYTYDVYDRRIAKSVDSDGDGAAAATEERYVYDGEHIALVFDGDGNQLSRYLHGPQVDQILAEETADGEVRWALSDHQGNVRDVVDSEGTVLNHLTYDSYGQVTSETTPEVDFRFGYTGRERDEETGLYYYRARYFDPAVGTFVSEDPLGFAAGDASVYRYVFNSPTNYTDPDGESSIALVPLAIGLGLGVGAIGASLYIDSLRANRRNRNSLGGPLDSSNGIDTSYDPRLEPNGARDIPSPSLADEIWDLPGFPRDAYNPETLGGFCEAPQDLANPSTPGFGSGARPVTPQDFVFDVRITHSSGNNDDLIDPTIRSRFPEAWAEFDFRRIQAQTRASQAGFEGGRHDQFSSEMRDELRRLADEADARGDLPEYSNRIREIADTFETRANSSSHRGGGRAGRGRR